MPTFLNKVGRHPLANLIKLGRVLPVISQQVMFDRFFGGHVELVKHYADYSGYPLADNDNLLKMIKFYGVNNDLRDWQVKLDYLTFLKEHHLLKMVENSSDADHDALEVAYEQINRDPGQTFSDFAGSLGYPEFGQPEDDPFLILANLPLPIYLTTSQHTFFEDALLKAKKTPRTEFCRWKQGLELPASIFDEDSFELDVKRPIVFHLFGLDQQPESLILTEDDYLQFVVSISRHGEPGDPIPSVIRERFALSFWVFLGFGLPSWDFRALFWGLIKPAIGKSDGAFTLQLEYSEVEKKYLKKYMDEEASLTVEWKDIETYTGELRDMVSGNGTGKGGHV